MGASNKALDQAAKSALQNHCFKITTSLDSLPVTSQDKWIVADERARLSMLKGRGSWSQDAFDRCINILARNKAGFFMMAEGAQVDHGAHDNNLPWLATEVMDFDQLVGRALQFADTNGETLVIVTADHETGGLTLLDGNYDSSYISARFVTDDHTLFQYPFLPMAPIPGFSAACMRILRCFIRSCRPWIFP
ncbi:alkaline phosphatase [Paraflavitalea speifideaquila]|uniref:alkaline phosphatase n=1 Tax=Paraflavitalea speifideaquila TaxID=3076558 RepID=UPI0028EE0E5F|nr:alkaline phosphatase [Paraflavitalea speifideiaquila]